MKIGLISDIHANLEGLERALALFKKQDVRTILCAGDLVDGDWDGDAVVELIDALSIPCVKGNHDESIHAYLDWVHNNFAANDPRAKAELLTEETLEFLLALPDSLEFTFGETRVVLAHGTPWDNTDYIFPETPQKYFEQIVNQCQADILILGHTHVPMCKQVGKSWVINPGSVYGNRREIDSSCAILELDPFSVTFYDLDSLKVIRTCGNKE